MSIDSVLLKKILLQAGITAGGLLLFYILFYLLKLWSGRKKNVFPGLIDQYLYLPGLLLFITASLKAGTGMFRVYFSQELYAMVLHGLRVLLICSFGFLVLRTVAVFREMLIFYYERKQKKDYTLRSVKTKFTLIQKVINVLIITFIAGSVLMTFDNIRQMGSTLLASAGIAGIVLGFAAQKTLGSLLAGIQIAIAQPVKIDDIVVVDGQFGTVGEITLTYLVVNSWDGKRLIVPINYFLEHTFENWTRVSPEVIGKVKVYADYTLPVDRVRKEFEKWLQETALWDRRKAALLVTDADDKTIEVRATMSAKDSDDAFDLECYIREKLVTYIQEKYPGALPVSRLKLKEVTGNGVLEEKEGVLD